MLFAGNQEFNYEASITRATTPFDRAAHRPRFAPPGTIFGVGAICLLMLALLLPKPDTLMRSVMHGDLRDHVVEQYLWNLLRAQPEDDNLRFRLAEQRVALHKFSGALYLLQPLMDSGDIEWHRRASRLAVEALEQQYYAALPDSNERASLGAQIKQHMQWLLNNDDNPVLLERLATKALAIGEPVTAARIYQRIASMGERWPEWYADAARVALAAGDHETSARFYAIAEARTGTPESKQTFMLAALKALEAGDRVDEAVALASQAQGDLGATAELREYLVHLYAVSRPSSARALLHERLSASITAGLASESTNSVLERLLQQARMLGDSSLTLKVLQRAAETNPNREASWYENAARLALSQGEYQASARFFWSASSQSATRDKRRQYYVAGLRALQAGNIVASGLDEAESKLGDLSADRDTLYVMAQLALAAHRLDLAERYAKRMLRPDA
ncbi:MAG: hypothetical protein U1F34_01655 [Gammaproteobacteria bacterium]